MSSSTAALLDRPSMVAEWIELYPHRSTRPVRLLERPVEVVDVEESYPAIRLVPYQGDLDVV